MSFKCSTSNDSTADAQIYEMKSIPATQLKSTWKLTQVISKNLNKNQIKYCFMLVEFSKQGFVEAFHERTHAHSI